MKAVKITRENYATFAVDYLDGNINSIYAAAFLSFLDENPDLKEEFTGLLWADPLPADEMEMPLKQTLKHDYDLDALNINLQNYDYYFVAWFEDDLTEPGQNNVNDFVKRHPEVKRDFELFSQSRLLHEPAAVYPAKANLKQTIIVPLWMRVVPIAAFAATLLLLISVYLRVEPASKEELNQAIGGHELTIPSQSENNITAVESSDFTAEENQSTPDSEVRATDGRAFQATASAERKAELPVELKHLPAQRIAINTAAPIDDNPRQKYTSLFDDIQLSQELMLSAAEEKLAGKNNSANSSYGRIFNRIVSTGAQVASQLPTTIDPWLLADLGMNGFNVLTNNDIKIRRYMDNEGKTQKIQLIDRDDNKKLFSSN